MLLQFAAAISAVVDSEQFAGQQCTTAAAAVTAAGWLLQSTSAAWEGGQHVAGLLGTSLLLSNHRATSSIQCPQSAAGCRSCKHIHCWQMHYVAAVSAHCVNPYVLRFKSPAGQLLSRQCAGGLQCSDTLETSTTFVLLSTLGAAVRGVLFCLVSGRIEKFCMEPTSFTVKEDSQFKTGETEFVKTKLMTRLTYTLDQV